MVIMLRPHCSIVKPSLSPWRNWGPTESSSLPPLTAHYLILIGENRPKVRLLIKDLEKKTEFDTIKRERDGERKRWGHVLINQRLISTKLITGSWMWGKEGWKDERKKQRKDVTWWVWIRRWEFCPCLFPITPPNLSHSPQRSDHKPSLWLSQKTFIGCQFA